MGKHKKAAKAKETAAIDTLNDRIDALIECKEKRKEMRKIKAGIALLVIMGISAMCACGWMICEVEVAVMDTEIVAQMILGFLLGTVELCIICLVCLAIVTLDLGLKKEQMNYATIKKRVLGIDS